MSYGDSKAVFKRRCEEIGFEPDVIELIINHGLDTMAKFAFACHFSPGSADESPLIQLAKEIMRCAPSTVEMSCVRRLFSESYANIAADIKNSVEATDDMPTRRLAPAERAERLRLQQQRLSGVNISGPYEPGDALVDKCMAIYDADRIQFIPWDICTSREHEILHGSNRDQTLTFDSTGVLKLHKQTRVEPCNTASEIQVRYCLARRALAMEQANIVSFKNMEAWSEKMMQLRLDEPPPNYIKTTMQQLESADRKLFSSVKRHERVSNATSRDVQLTRSLKNAWKVQRCCRCCNHVLEEEIQELDKQSHHQQVSGPARSSKVAASHVERDLASLKELQTLLFAFPKNCWFFGLLLQLQRATDFAFHTT